MRFFVAPGIFKLLLVVIVVFTVFGAGKLPDVMGDLGKGIKNLKDGLKGEETAEKITKEDDKESHS